MAQSPLGFLRGSADVMAADLATTPITGLRVQVCGDAHLNNFGWFASPRLAQVFGLTDFDESLPGPWEWDLKRLAVSLVVVGRGNAFPSSDNRNLVLTAVRSYRERMAELAAMPYLDVWYARTDETTAKGLTHPRYHPYLDRVLRKVRRRTRLSVFRKMVEAEKGHYRIRDQPPLITHYERHADADESRRFYEAYRASLPDEQRLLLDRYHVVDIARKVVGVGSVGTRCAVILLMGDEDALDPLFLQVKQAFPSVLEPFVGKSVYSNHARRVVDGERLMQETVDIFLGYSTLRDRDYYLRQLRDLKFKTDITTVNAFELAGYAQLIGRTLARAHARTGDPAAIGGYLGNKGVFDHAVADFAEAYATQTERDYAELLKAIKQGRVLAEVENA